MLFKVVAVIEVILGILIVVGIAEDESVQCKEWGPFLTISAASIWVAITLVVAGGLIGG